ncbi:hypothetical protein B0T17DRAFT_510982 [Bombardia bombarda]|uniref:Uncharacterized protein n=1 Tax=Bombardia bombarda TaxID=252184 RepID=A0AA39WGY4_9PEZI|nr:hypothetical protein B0T17DRAFT_510982 [Bombardia bombarda]
MLAIWSLMLLGAATRAGAQTIDSLQPCGQTCYNNLLANAARRRLLENENGFTNTPASAATSAVPTTPITDTSAASAAAATPPLSTAAPPTTAAETSSVGSATSTPLPSQTLDATSTTLASSSPSIPSSSSTFFTSTKPQESASSSSGLVVGQGSTATSSTASGPSSSASAAGAAAAPGSATSKEDQDPLSTGAKVGIVIGAVVGAAVLIAFGAWMVMSRRMKKQNQRKKTGYLDKSLTISEPMPGSGRSFANDHQYEAGISELELKSRRYEDMVPRHMPRNMVSMEEHDKASARGRKSGKSVVGSRRPGNLVPGLAFTMPVSRNITSTPRIHPQRSTSG